MYLLNQLHYTEQQSKVIYHTYVMLVYFFPILGSFLADNWYGKYNVVVYLSLIYASGNFLLAFASGLDFEDLPKMLSLLGLFLISFGTGGIKPCVAAFGGDQFVLPEQEHLMKRYFSIYYFITSTGSLLSTFLTPILAEKVHCFNHNSCYPLAFGVPGFLMVISFILFVIGKSGYVCKKPTPGDNTVFKVLKCIYSAVKNRFRKISCNEPKPTNFIDYASDEKYPQVFRDQVKSVLKVLTLFIAFPLYWTLYDQKASNWLFLAKKMDRTIFNSYEILPDHMLLINPLLTVILIPVFEVTVYPCCAKFGLLINPLHRMVLGALFMALAFFVASGVFVYVETNSQLHVLWLIPQYVLLTVSEVLFSVTGVQFSYSEAPESMKSVIQAIWLLTTTIGNFIFVFLSEAEFVHGGVSFVMFTFVKN